MLSVPEADRLIHAAFGALSPTATERVPIADAVGRVLAEQVVADRDQPPFHRVAMDGIAVSSIGRTDWQIDGVLHAGSAQPQGAARAQADKAIEVMTGAALPAAWTTVIPWEDLEPAEPGVPNRRLRTGATVKPGQNIHTRASDYLAGAALLEPGVVLSAAHLHTLASVGLAQVPVRSRPGLSLIATGDELVPIEAMPLDHQIRQSNMIAINAYCRFKQLGPVTIDHVSDNRALLSARLSQALRESQVILVSGGVSMGHKDYVPGVLSELGCREVFHRVAQKPGKPLWFGTGPQGQIVFGLPGNPVSSLFAFRRYILPHLTPYGSGDQWLPLSGDQGSDPKYTCFYPAQLTTQVNGQLAVQVRRHQGSGNFASIVPSDGIIEIPASDQAGAAGSLRHFWPWY